MIMSGRDPSAGSGQAVRGPHEHEKNAPLEWRTPSTKSFEFKTPNASTPPVVLTYSGPSVSRSDKTLDRTEQCCGVFLPTLVDKGSA